MNINTDFTIKTRFTSSITIKEMAEDNTEHEHTVEVLPDGNYLFSNIKGCGTVTLNKEGFETYCKLINNNYE